MRPILWFGLAEETGADHVVLVECCPVALENVTSSKQSCFDGHLPRLSPVAIKAGPDGMRVLYRQPYIR